MEEGEIVIEELELEDEHKESSAQPQGTQRGAPADYRIVQPDTDRDGKKILTGVGSIWVNKSKTGNEYFSIRIGKLRLLAFKNDKERFASQSPKP